jgi:hypothetical protein
MFSSESWLANPSSGFYNGVATQSLRFDRASDPYLNRTATLGDRKTWTFSTWLKRSGFTNAVQYLFGTNVSNNDATSANIHIGSDNTITVAPWANHFVKTNAILRDVSAWYHIVVDFDTTQAGSGNSSRVNIYINGVDQPLTNGGATLGQNTDWAINLNQANTRIGDLYGDANELDGYLAETNFVDGLSLDASYFGETKNGVWIPKEPVVSDYGTNGFRLKFNANGLNTSSGTVSSPTNIGDDSSGKNNHFSVSNGIVASDCAMPDSPENNFCTLNALYNIVYSPGTLSKGSLRYDNSAWNQIASTFAFSSGKWYFEVRADSYNSSAQALTVGIRETGRRAYATYWHQGSWSNSLDGYVYGVGINGTTESKITGASATSLSGNPDIVANSVIGIAIDLDSSTTSIKYNVDGGTLFTLFEDMQELTYHPAINGYQAQATVNFGQDSSFAGEETATTNSDANGNGTFHSAVPSGYLSLCSNNLQEPTIGPNSLTQADDHFNTVLWTGNGADDRSISGVGFQPDFVWLKQRNGTNYHTIFDSTRGATKALYPNDTEDEATNADTLQAFESDGFEVGTSGGVNGNNNTFVAWNWKAGGTTPSKTYKVVVVSDSGNKYRFRNSADSATFGASAVALNLQEGGTYTFDYSDSTATSHPFRFSTTSDGTHGGGSEYTTGVVKDDTAKTITITVASSASTLYYYCSSHSGMGGQVNTNTTHGSTNFDGSLLSVSNSNTDAGFSIVTYTGDNGSSATVGHGLGAVPAMIIVKVRNTTNHWAVYHQSLGNTKSAYLSLPQAPDTNASFWNNTSPTSSVFTIGTDNIVNASQTYVAYCFSEIESYSRFGSYTGNGNADGAMIFTNFSPSFLMYKKTSAAGRWTIVDSVRNPHNVVNRGLYANYVNVEDDTGSGYWDVDFLSNGFKFRTTETETNGSGASFIYMAFAKNPTKYSLAR